jgi:branched-chain amino acid transport system ATP-binding protein
MLEVNDLHAYYGKSHILHGVHTNVQQRDREPVRATAPTFHHDQAIWVSRYDCAIRFKQQQPSGLKTTLSPARLKRAENRHLPTLTVRQNPQLGMKQHARSAGASTTCLPFRCVNAPTHRPEDVRRRAADADALPYSDGRPELIMIDEPTEGLAPKIVEQVARLFEEIRNRGVSILLVEQKLTIALKISKRLYVMGHGQIVFEGTPDQLRGNEAVRKEWLEV